VFAEGAKCGNLPFTIKDAVEFTRFSHAIENGPSDVVLFSPDHAYVVFVTRRADIAADAVVETLWLLRTADLSAAIRSKVAWPKATELHSFLIHNEHGEIARLRWTSQSSIAFVAEGPNKVNQAFEYFADRRSLLQLTRSATDVVSFDISNSVILYYAVHPVDLRTAFRIAGRSNLNVLLEPSGESALALPSIDLWVQSRTVGISAHRLPIGSVALRSDFQTLWLSPSGRYAVAFAPATNWPKYWSDYRTPKYDLFGFTQDRTNPDPTSVDLLLRTRYRLIDLQTGQERALLDAPDGYLSLNQTPARVFWLPGEHGVIVTSTFLPLQGGTLATRQTSPYIVEVDIDPGEIRPIVAEPSEPGPNFPKISDLKPITDVEWNESTNELSVYRDAQRRTFVRSGGSWREQSADLVIKANAPINVTLRQSSNDRPKLFVESAGCVCSKPVFDPNEGADRFDLGTAKPFSWTDGNRRSWTGELILPTDFKPGDRLPLVIQTHAETLSEFLVDGPSDYTTAFPGRAFVGAHIAVLQMTENTSDGAAVELNGEEAVFAEAIRAAVLELSTRGVVDPAKVGAIAFSHTGLAIMGAVTRFPNLLKAADFSDAATPGYFSHIFSYANTKDLTAQVDQAMGIAGASATAETWLKKSSIPLLEKTRAAIRFEAIGPFSLVVYAEPYGTMLNAGLPTELIYFPNASHVLYRPAQRVQSQGGNLDWFRFWLKNYEDPDPAKRGQYMRWEALRGPRDTTLK
jgi:hypothetical protein